MATSLVVAQIWAASWRHKWGGWRFGGGRRRPVAAKSGRQPGDADQGGGGSCWH
ncbi:UNVERIFIED_CONTAM: hypothetical protein Sradi_3342200 [Sesamum radiatum]|uniref:Uncharacterized protein n=1 Tax=Sesamum radiatum TaxID=300843 RepID=A0AAW2R220_SESRA